MLCGGVGRLRPFLAAREGASLAGARWAADAAPDTASPPPRTPQPPEPHPASGPAFTEREFRPQWRPSPSAAPPRLDFDDPRAASQDKSVGELMRALVVFRACRSRWLVGHADALLAGSKRVLGSTLVNWVVRHTFYRQFVAGEDAAEIQPVLDRLRRSGIHAVLDYAAEDDVSEEGPQSRQPAVASAVARTYSYEDEAACDRRMAHFLTSIDAAASQGGQGFAAIKVSALGLPSLLERASAALTAIRGLFSQLDANGDGWLEAAEFRAEYSRLFKDDGADRMDQVFAHLDTNRDGRVDYLSFAERVSVYDGAAIAARCRQEGPFSRAALSPAELRLLDATLRRVHALAAAAAGRGVRLMVDAEQSSMQPAIDAIVAALQREHNRERAAVFGTYQCYLADAPARLALDLERARRGGYLFGAKLVRGAYMHLERRRAEAAGAPSPVWGSAGETHAAYDAAVATMLPRVREQGAEVMVATHNKASVERAVAGMAAEGLQPSAPVYFGQLFGMADHLTYALGQNGFRAYKYVPFGPIDEVLPYLVRRAQENSDVLGGAGREAALGAAALRRRLRWRV